MLTRSSLFTLKCRVSFLFVCLTGYAGSFDITMDAGGGEHAAHIMVHRDLGDGDLDGGNATALSSLHFWH
jgi:hypothetical protein